jgi:Domain of unknown function (DUF5979)
VALEAGHPCPDAAASAYRAPEIRPVDGGFVGRDWALAQIDVTVPAGTTWLAFQLEPTDRRTGANRRPGGVRWMAGQVLLKLPSPVGTAATVTIDNPLAEIGTILVAKAVTGDVEGYVDGTLFGITFDCTVDDFDGTNFLGDGEGILIDGIPVGTECTISETELPAPADGFEYGAPVFCQQRRSRSPRPVRWSRSSSRTRCNASRLRRNRRKRGVAGRHRRRAGDRRVRGLAGRALRPIAQGAPD